MYDFSGILAEGGPMIEPLIGAGLFRAGLGDGSRLAKWLDVDPINLYMQLRDAGALARVAAE